MSVTHALRLDGRVAVITGGAGVVGRVAALALAELGADVALVDRDGARATTVAKEVAGAWQTEAQAWEVDLEHPDATADVCSRVEAWQDRIDVLIQAAAWVGSDAHEGWAVPFEAQTCEAFSRSLGVNLVAPFALDQALAPWLAASGHGSIVHVSSIHAGIAPDFRLYADTDMGHPAGYAASKAGLSQLTRWLATALAPNVRVNTLSPGGIRRDQPAVFRRRYAERTPLGRMAEPDDLGGAFVYLASDLSRYVTGHDLVVDGGYTIW